MTVDDYVLDVLMVDLVGHDHAPSAYLVFLHLWSQTLGRDVETVALSYHQIASATGLSKSAVQVGVRRLVRRRLIRVEKESATATPVYTVLRPWQREVE